MRLCLLIIALVVSFPSSAIDISNFRSGLECDAGWICQPTEDVLVTDQGTCVFNGAERPCTWVGFEFDYAGAAKGTKLQCTDDTSLPVDRGNPEGLVAQNATSETFELELPAEQGHFFNPQYFIFATRPAAEANMISTMRCSLNGKVLFEFTFNVHFPTSQDS
jgi:hypothetical protein